MVKEKIKTLEKIIKIGNSIGITISREAVEALSLEVGDLIQVAIEIVKKVEKKKEKKE